MWKEAVVAYLTHHGSIFVDELRRITRNHRTADLGVDIWSWELPIKTQKYWSLDRIVRLACLSEQPFWNADMKIMPVYLAENNVGHCKSRFRLTTVGVGAQEVLTL